MVPEAISVTKALPLAISVVAQLKTKTGVGYGVGGTLGATEGAVEPAWNAFTACLGGPYATVAHS
jgi:hypothetical protein